MVAFTTTTTLTTLALVASSVVSALPRTTNTTINRRQLDPPTSDPFRISTHVIHPAQDLSPSIEGWQLLTAPPSSRCSFPLVISPIHGGVFAYGHDQTILSLGRDGDNNNNNNNGGNSTLSTHLYIHDSGQGTATIPAGDVVSAECYGETDGFYGTENGLLLLHYEDYTWMACPEAVLFPETAGAGDGDGDGDGGYVFLSYKKDGQRTLKGCADVELQIYVA